MPCDYTIPTPTFPAPTFGFGIPAIPAPTLVLPKFMCCKPPFDFPATDISAALLMMLDPSGASKQAAARLAGVLQNAQSTYQTFVDAYTKINMECPRK